jgi:hypothetical protein
VTEVRAKQEPSVINSETRRAKEQAAAQANSVERAAEATAAAETPLVRPLGANDQILSTAHAIASATGTVTVLMLLPLLTLGVLLGAGSATVGVEQTVSAFIWTLVISIFVMPIGEFIGFPWTQGALTNYTSMTQHVDWQCAGAAEAMNAATFYARFALLPLVCVAGVAMTGLRFASGVNAGIIPKENLRLDPVLEKEAANMKASSLHGGRAGAALRAAGMNANASSGGNGERRPAMAGAGASAGEAPRRLI